MPEIVTEPVTFGRGRGSSAPWADYFQTYAGQVVKFSAGTDFDIKPRSFAIAAQDYAKRNAMGQVRTSVSDEAVVLKFPTAAETKAAKLAAAQAAELAGQEAITV